MKYHIDTCKTTTAVLDFGDTLDITANDQHVAELDKLKAEAIRNLLLRCDHKVDAIRDYRAFTGVGLFDAKNTIDGVMAFYDIKF